MLSAIFVTALLEMGIVMLIQRYLHSLSTEIQAVAQAADRDTWRMPPLAELTPPAWSAARTVEMLTLRRYLLIAAPSWS